MLAQMLKKDVPDYRGMPTSLQEKTNFVRKAWEGWLSTYFEQEEKRLFPSLDREKFKDLHELLSEQRTEIKTLILDLSSLEQQDALGRLLERNVRIKERQLFQMIQAFYDEKEMERLGQALGS